ncbi:MAG TPA: LCP family protein [Acidimicrobiia bacterium]|nr:LCP family protein [Acidimicrobiia bacterium]
MKKRLIIAGALVAALLLAVGASLAMSTWRDVNRVSIDRETPIETPDDEPSGEEQAAADTPRVDSVEGLEVFLLVGSDSRNTLDDVEGFGDFDGERADVVMVLLRPADGSRAALLSLPRDLLVDDICRSGRAHRLNDALQGCDTVNGPTALTRTVEEVIDQTVDHLAMVDLAGFQEAVDEVGGYEICVERAVRDQRAQLQLPAGCTHASGAQTLAWLRSRSTQELTENGWRTMPGVNDLTRNQRQREFLLSMLGRLSNFGSPTDIAEVARSIAPHVTVDSELSFIDAVNLAWTMRGLSRGNIDELEIPVSDATTASGAAVLVAEVDIADLVDDYLAPEIAEDPTGAFAG